MQTSPTIGAIAAAIAKTQADLKNIHRDANNTFFKSRYAPLDTVLDVIRPVCAKHGIAFIQGCEADAAVVKVTTRLCHESGEWIESTLTAVAKDAGPQAVGSAVTYLRRYGIQGMVGVAATDDDDAEAGEGRQTETPKAQPTSRTDALKAKVAAKTNGKGSITDRVHAIVERFSMAGWESSDARKAQAHKILGHPFNPAHEADVAALEKWLNESAEANVANAAEVLAGGIQ